MNNSIYDEYMRNILGYQPVTCNNTYDMNYNRYEIPNIPLKSNLEIQELENCYPDIYRIVYPMVQKVCKQNTRNINREIVERMTDEVYFAIEDREMLENRSQEEKKSESDENRQTFRDQRLNDLIRILILRELLSRHHRSGIKGNKQYYIPTSQYAQY